MSGVQRPGLAALRRLVLALSCLFLADSATQAGELDRAGLARYFPPPLVVGEKDDILPVWPILKQQAGSYEVFAYAFESIDFAPIPGFGGTPPDLLVALAPDGTFRDVKVLSHREPVFLEGLGSEPLFAFVEQYVGLSARQPIRVGRPNARASGASPQTTVDGIAMATASTRTINQSVLASALAVARGKLGFGAANVGLRVEAKADLYEPLGLDALLARGWVRRLTVTRQEAARAFRGTGLEEAGEGAQDDILADLYVALLDVPSIGRNLLGPARFEALMRELGPGNHAVMVLSAGPSDAPENPLGESFVLGSVPERVSVGQGGLVVNARDMAVERRGAGLAEGLPAGDWTILRIDAAAGFDPSVPWMLTDKIVRERGQILSEKITRDFSVETTLPGNLFHRESAQDGPDWTEAWRARLPALVGIAGMVALLVPVLVWQRRLVADARRFPVFRLAFLAVTVAFVGYGAQAQLSIVTLMGLVRAALRTHDFAFLLYDPPSLVLWAFVLGSLVLWGRGTFCGWLCPFGAMQELIAWLGCPLRIQLVVVPPALDQALRKAKYVVLVGLLAATAAGSPAADAMAEVEPFKTAITLSFLRSWPFVAYAVGLLVLNLFVYKGFCRYLCPLGAGLALAGRLRILDWIPRRSECGTPCQLCKVRCRYGAIAADGRIDYPECFQCMDCVTIIHDPGQCVPQVVARRHAKRIVPRPVPAR
ncbi:4Fe-4S binding protein [Methylobacterium persicinum]|uniref:Transcriptional regulator of nitric oxide reductase n=1 Tax=Methylobacterium persicinum TaxID=374426 RepID=A0ABU0HRI1_9HYPH|nr:4Fe-4S binding protein [Methylobacterium persicinum]MDQ0444931.1 transcriptional regulator of nitric oxide reductase [Methylobacterium persicinum]